MLPVCVAPTDGGERLLAKASLLLWSAFLGVPCLGCAFRFFPWSDYLSMGGIMTLVRDFNTQGDLYQLDSGCGVAADMTDCFRHLPIDKSGMMWGALSELWSSKGTSGWPVVASLVDVTTLDGLAFVSVLFAWCWLLLLARHMSA